MKSTGGNSANFIAMRGLYTGGRIAGNVYYDENYAIAIGPTWGFQRKKEILIFFSAPVLFTILI